MSFHHNKKTILKSLSSPAYPIATTSRLIGLTRWSVSRYLKGYEYFGRGNKVEGKVKRPPVVSQSYQNSNYASFLDLIDLLYIKEFLNRGFTLQYLRRALDEAKEYLGAPHFARSEFYTSANEIIVKLPKNGVLIALMKGGQLAIPEIAEKLSDKLDFESISEYGYASRWYPRGKNGYIVIDPQISFGRPTLIQHGVATANVYDLYLGEKERIKPVSEWFNIPAPQIKAAVQFEHSLWA